MKRITFEKPWIVGVTEDHRSFESTFDKAEIIIRNAVSVVSAGTELAILSGGESWAPLPYTPGYGSVGTIVEDRRPGGKDIGKMVFTYGTHSEYAATSVVTVEVPRGLAPSKAVFARMGAVSMTALRVSDVELGDKVAVFGAGVVGNMAAQLCALSGAYVIVIDKSRSRLEVARRCGADAVIVSSSDVVKEVRELTGGAGCTTVIEATGSPAVVPLAARCAANQGEVILLGSPRGVLNADVTGLLNLVHLSPGVVTLKGAHEWRYPVTPSNSGYPKHSIRRNLEIVLGLIASGKLKVEELTSHRVKPDAAPEMYRGLRESADDFLGVVFEWEA
jgi:threonine dehydrogenase-like Zn-dependent dehydrogenase